MNDAAPPPVRRQPEGTHLHDDSLIDLVLGVVPEEHRVAAMNHLRRCPACEEALRQCAAEHERLRAVPPGLALGMADSGRRVGSLSLPQDVQMAHPRVTSKSQTPRGVLRPIRSFPGRPMQFWVPATVALAAAAVIVVGLTVQTRAPALEVPLLSLPGEFNEKRAAGDELDSNLVAGLRAYQRRDLETAIRHLRAAQPSEAFEPLRLLYLGSALAASHRFAEAADVLAAPQAQMAPEPWGAEAQWALYVALRGLGRGASAESLRKVLADEPGRLGERARSARR